MTTLITIRTPKRLSLRAAIASMAVPRGTVQWVVTWFDAGDKVFTPDPDSGVSPFSDGVDPQSTVVEFDDFDRAAIYARSLIRRHLDAFGQVQIDRRVLDRDPEYENSLQWIKTETWIVDGVRKADTWKTSND